MIPGRITEGVNSTWLLIGVSDNGNGTWQLTWFVTDDRGVHFFVDPDSSCGPETP